VTSFNTSALTLIIVSLNCARPTRGYKEVIITIPASLLPTWQNVLRTRVITLWPVSLKYDIIFTFIHSWAKWLYCH